MSNRIRIIRNPLTLSLQFVGVRDSLEDPNGKRFIGISSGNNISILNENLSVGSGVSIFLMRDIPYTRFMDSDGVDFANVGAAVSYINDASSVGATRLRSNINSLTFNVTSGQSFEYNALFQRASSYYWDESSFPAGVQVSSADNRKLYGTISSTGTYYISLEVANYFGLSSETVTLIVS